MSFLKYFDYIENKFHINPKQILMLKAITKSGLESSQYFLEWIECIDLDTADFNSFKLIPSLYDKFRHTYADHKYFPRMRGIYRYFLLKNNLVMSDGKTIAKKLSESGIDMILFKGMALQILYYKKLGLRHMGDIDVLIQREKISLAEKILVENNWRYRYIADKKGFSSHSYDYVNTHNHGFDLHWLWLGS